MSASIRCTTCLLACEGISEHTSPARAICCAAFHVLLGGKAPSRKLLAAYANAEADKKRLLHIPHIASHIMIQSCSTLQSAGWPARLPSLW